MPRTHFIVMALTGTALAAVPANAGGLLGGGAANCLCQTVNGLTSGGSPEGAASIARGIRQKGVVSRGSHGKLITNRSIAGNVTGSVSNALKVTVARSTNWHGGHSNANIGLAGRVSGASGINANLNGVSRSVDLAGNSSAHASANKRIGLSIAGLGATHGQSIAGQVANVSALNKLSGKGRSLANVAVLNGRGGTSGKVANVSILNKTGTSGRSLANVAALNGSAGGTGRLANVSILNGRHGNGHGNGGFGLPNGVQIINGVPCGPDGKPLTGAAAATVMAMVGGKDRNGGPSHGSGSPTAGNSGNGPSASSGGSQSGSAASGDGQPRERDLADRKDLWWPQHTEGSYRDGRLNDH